MNNNDPHTESANAFCPVDIRRVRTGQAPELTTDRVITEQAVTVMVDKVGSYTIMATPSDLEALAVGFVYSEGLINDYQDCLAVAQNPKRPDVVGIEVHNPAQIDKRNLIVASACGLCGVRNIEKMLTGMPPCEKTLSVSAAEIIRNVEAIRSSQVLFELTGGAHAVGILNAAGTVIAFAEDIGRHNAFDKAVGKCLIARLETKGCRAVLSGRVSFDMVAKAARAGIEIVAAVSAPSSFAVEAANRWNITVCGFVRKGRMNIYTHPERIPDIDGETLTHA